MTFGRCARSLAALTWMTVLALALVGCGSTSGGSGGEVPRVNSMKIGTLATEDSLPLWVAEEEGYFTEAGLSSVEIVVFQSAQERDAAFTAGAIDAFMGDIIAAANLEAAEKPGTILTVMLGADPSQGRFGVAVPPKSTITTLTQLAGVPVGTSSATIQEYVLDGLMEQAGVARDKVVTEEVKKVPVRYELLMQGKLKAAALPEPFLSLAEKSGGTVIGDDTKSPVNLSQTILFCSDEYLSQPGGTKAADAVLAAWDLAAADINAAPDTYMPLLVEKARLPKPLEGAYKMNSYPTQQLPKKTEVEAVLAWMTDKGYLKAEVTYEDLTLVLPNK